MTKNNVPFDVAFAISDVSFDDEMTLPAVGFALAVLFGQFEGGEFDWDQLRWIEKHG